MERYKSTEGFLVHLGLIPDHGLPQVHGQSRGQGCEGAPYQYPVNSVAGPAMQCF